MATGPKRDRRQVRVGQGAVIPATMSAFEGAFTPGGSEVRIQLVMIAEIDGEIERTVVDLSQYGVLDNAVLPNGGVWVSYDAGWHKVSEIKWVAGDKSLRFTTPTTPSGVIQEIRIVANIPALAVAGSVTNGPMSGAVAPP